MRCQWKGKQSWKKTRPVNDAGGWAILDFGRRLNWEWALFYMLYLPGKSVILFRSNSSVLSHLTAFGCETAAQPCDINLHDSAATQNCMKGPIWCNRRLTPTTGVPLLSTLFQKLTAQLTNTQEKPTAAGFHTFLTAGPSARTETCPITLLVWKIPCETEKRTLVSDCENILINWIQRGQFGAVLPSLLVDVISGIFKL